MRSKLYWNKVTKGVKNLRQINYKCNISLGTYENEEIYLQLCGGKTGINAVHKIITECLKREEWQTIYKIQHCEGKTRTNAVQKNNTQCLKREQWQLICKIILSLVTHIIPIITLFCLFDCAVIITLFCLFDCVVIITLFYLFDCAVVVCCFWSSTSQEMIEWVTTACLQTIKTVSYWDGMDVWTDVLIGIC